MLTKTDNPNTNLPHMCIGWGGKMGEFRGGGELGVVNFLRMMYNALRYWILSAIGGLDMEKG